MLNRSVCSLGSEKTILRHTLSFLSLISPLPFDHLNRIVILFAVTVRGARIRKHGGRPRSQTSRRVLIYVRDCVLRHRFPRGIFSRGLAAEISYVRRPRREMHTRGKIVRTQLERREERERERDGASSAERACAFLALSLWQIT